MSLRLRLLVGAAGLAAAALLALYVPGDLGARGAHYVAWVAICVLSEAMWVTTLSGAGTNTMASTAGLASIMLWGQGPAMWIGAVSTLLAELLVLRKPAVRAVFNASQITITHWGAAGAWMLLGGPAEGLESAVSLASGVEGAARLALPVLGLFSAYLLINRALVAAAVAWSTEQRYARVLREDWFFADHLIADAANFMLSPLMVISFQAIQYVGVLLFYGPLRMIHESSKRYNELQNAQQQIIHTERMAAKGEMAAEVGHELRNQLAAISGRAQMILRDAEKGAFENVARHAQIVLDQSKRMEGLSKGLMDFSRAELHVERVDVNQLITRSIEFVRTQNRFDGVEWRLELAEPGPVLRADPGQLQQVLLNLFMNAADAMNERGAPRKVLGVSCSLDASQRNVRIVVSDNGVGIAASNLSRIFEPHFTTKPEGHGFGLSTSYRIITNHGGRIVAESPGGGGAIFTVTLPLQKDAGWGARG
uniref:histidine kinase n=1 Tax=Eiseniibacteriota bacterium TaxID=2212470 RepID=A0A832I1J5_UNCEI